MNQMPFSPDEEKPPAMSLMARLRFPALFNREMLRYLGPGFLVTVGFIDPGNWATNIAGGSEFNYSLLWVITLSTLMLILLQHMAAHLGIVTGECLAEGCRRWFGREVNWVLGGSIVLACIATALAEFLGAAYGCTVLFGWPLWLSGLVSGVLVLGLVAVQKYEQIEHLIIAFVSIIGFCYLVELWMVKPDWGAAARAAVIPQLDSRTILIAMGMLGAVVMPHNLYLHSEVIQKRNWVATDPAHKRRLLRYEFLDTLLAMGLGWLINCAMIVVAAAVFFRNGVVVKDILQAAQTLKPLAGDLARLLFGVALLCAGLSSSITACLAGGTVFTGFLGKEIDPQKVWFRAGVLITALPALAILMVTRDVFQTLIWSQVVLSMQLPFTVLPLILLTRSSRVMGEYANGKTESILLYMTFTVLVVLNGLLLLDFFGIKF
jgi:manganese transport protein